MKSAKLFHFFLFVGAWLLSYSSAKRPNIIFILNDDLGYGDIGVLHQNQKQGKKLSTPFMDQFAKEGMILGRHYCPAPVCVPSRASLNLGVHQGHAYTRNNQFDKALDNNHTLSKMLKAAGYSTYLVGKWGLQGGSKDNNNYEDWTTYPTKVGFDHFFGAVAHRDAHTQYSKGKKPFWSNDQEISNQLDLCYSTDLFTARAKQFIIDHKKESAAKPFFLMLTYIVPHAPLELPTMAYPKEKGVKGGVQWLGEPGKMINTAQGTMNSWIDPDYDTPDYNNVEKVYATIVRRLDESIEDLVQTLKDLNLDNNTIIVISSDNGPHKEKNDPSAFQSYGTLEGIKRDVLEGGIRVPSLVRWPAGIKAIGTRDETPTQFHDWMPTFAQLAGVPAPARTDGVSLVPLFSGEKLPFKNTVYVEYISKGATPKLPDFVNHGGDAKNEMQVIYLDGYKGMRRNIKSHEDVFEIYETKTDPAEGNNLANSSDYFKNLAKRMQNEVLRIRRPEATNQRPYDQELVPALNQSELGANQYQLFRGTFPWLPDFKTLTAVKKAPFKTIDLNTLAKEAANGIMYQGYIHIPADGNYTFTLKTNSKALLRIHSATVIDADYDYHPNEERKASILLQAGIHPFTLSYMNQEASDTPSLSIQVQGEQLPQQNLDALFLK